MSRVWVYHTELYYLAEYQLHSPDILMERQEAFQKRWAGVEPAITQEDSLTLTRCILRGTVANVLYPSGPGTATRITSWLLSCFEESISASMSHYRTSFYC